MDQILALRIPQPISDGCQPFPPDVLNTVPLSLLEQATDNLLRLKTVGGYRCDYSELILLSLMLLGKHKGDLLAYGSTSHARWTGNLLYEAKKYLLRGSLFSTDGEIKTLIRLNLIGAIVYCSLWARTANLFKVPEIILQLYQTGKSET